ncbi:prenyltransferase [Paenibacillus contaminans]|uniref:Prenyltransferase n=1 Tax=Paenibacillus contaminans TaxID=450362 RepID=A0A329MGT5_9BACL|nr:prenyltransferase [Paenibacillus contaminans]RAV19054.1 prenyltransferase [Paenibacillus contaminans]
MGKMSLFMRLSRFRVIPVMVIPVLIGGVGAYAWNDTFHPLLFLLTLIGAGTAHLFSNMINDLWDFRNGVDVAAKETASTISTNSGFLAKGAIEERKFAALTWLLFAVAVVCGGLLAVFSGPAILVYAGLGALLAFFYVAPPVKYGYRGKGYSEIAILLSFGVLPVVGSYIVQTSVFDWRALFASLPIGLLTTLILFNHHFLHWQSDKASGKKTLVVVWGERKALGFSKMLLVLAHLSLIAAVLVKALPFYALIGLLTAVPFIKVYGSLKDENPSEAYLPLMGASLKSTMRCGAVIILSLLLQGLIA